MRPAEQGFLLLTGALGEPCRRPLTVAQLRMLRCRSAALKPEEPDRPLMLSDLMGLGYSRDMAEHILTLLGEEELLRRYIHLGEKQACTPLTPVTPGYPRILREKLGWDCPGTLWAKGPLELLDMPRVALVGSRDIAPENRAFAWEAGIQAANQGFALVSGNARGADRIAQAACLQNGGCVICIVADELGGQPRRDRVLYLSEDGFDLEFSSQRALSRNRLIHALGEKVLVAQSGLGRGGTWDGSVKNLRNGWNPLFCFDDGSPVVEALTQLGAVPVSKEALSDLRALRGNELSF